MENTKTDLKKILSISGESGLFRYLAQAKSGIIAESLLSGQRKTFGPSARVSSMADIAIFTLEGEIPLQELFEKMAASLSGGEAISHKSDEKAVKGFFADVLPDYDPDRFYLSHMRKVLDWYNCLKHHATLEFEKDEEEGEAAAEVEENGAGA